MHSAPYICLIALYSKCQRMWYLFTTHKCYCDSSNNLYFDDVEHWRHGWQWRHQQWQLQSRCFVNASTLFAVNSFEKETRVNEPTNEWTNARKQWKGAVKGERKSKAFLPFSVYRCVVRVWASDTHTMHHIECVRSPFSIRCENSATLYRCAYLCMFAAIHMQQTFLARLW